MKQITNKYSQCWGEVKPIKEFVQKDMKHICKNSECTGKEECEEEDNDNDIQSVKKNASLGILGGIAICIPATKIVKEVRSQELELLKITNEDGRPIGHGYMLENCIVRENPGAKKINNPGSSSNPLLREKNGVDVILKDGTSVQCKCYPTAKGAYNSLMKNGRYRYGNQIPAVPKGQGEKLNGYLEDSGVNTPVLESDLTYNEIRKKSVRGIESACYDATNPTNIRNIVCLTVVVGILAYFFQVLNMPNYSWKRKAAFSAGVALIAFLIAESLVVFHGQSKRINV